jgi:hypothetical protein
VGKNTLRIFTAIAFVAIILLIAPTTIASTEWIRTYQGEPMDILTPDSVIQTSDGGYATATSGYIRRVDNLGYQGHFSQSYELQIMKTTSNGDVQWRQNFTQIDDPNHETPTLYEYTKPHIIAQTADQGYVIASSGAEMFWMFKVDSQGRVLWTKAYTQNEDNPSASSLYSMIQTNDGGFALAGSTFTSEGGTDFWLVKTDSQGKAQWNQTYNSGTYTDSMGTQYPREDEAKTVIQTRDGGYALAGSASLFRASTSSIVYASWMVKTDAQGKHLWNKGYDAPNDGEYSIIQTTDNGYAIAGTQNEDFYLLKTDPAGQLQWNKTYGDTLTDIPCGLVQLNDGGYAIAGTWTKINSTTTVSTMGLLRLDSSGQTIWTKTYNAKEIPPNVSHDVANDMIRTSDGSYVLVGSSLYDSETHQDIFFVKTETLEQPPQPTATPTLSSTIAPTSVPTGNPTYEPTDTTASSPPTTLPTQTPTSSGSSPQPSPSIPESPAGITISILAATTAILIGLRKKKLN